MVNSSSNNNFNVTAGAKSLFPQTNFGSAIGVAVSETESYSNAIINGKVTTTQGNLAVDAKSINVTHDTFTKVGVKNKGPKVPGAEDKINATTQGIGIRNAPGKFGISAGMSWSQGVNQANTKIGSMADLTVAKDLKVTSRAEDNFKSVAISGAKSGAEISIGGAVAFADYSNTANAFIDKNAKVNALGALTVTADAVVPNQVDVDNDLQSLISFRPDIPNFQESPVGSIQQGINTVLTTASLLLSYLKVVPTKLATTFALASAQAGDKDFGDPGRFALSGTGNILKATNTANAYIGQQAQVTAKQGVTITANAWSETINTAGVPPLGLLPPNTVKSEGSAVGGTYNDITLINNAKAFIDDGAVVIAETGDISVTANIRSFILNIAESGGKAADFGVSGAVAINDFQNTALAYIEDKATVRTNKNINVNANTDILGINVTGTVIQGGDVGAGASVTVNQLNNVTKAFIGNSPGDNDAGITNLGSVTAGEDLNVGAFTKERLVSIAIAAALASGDEPVKPGEDPLKGQDLPLGMVSSKESSSSGGSSKGGSDVIQGLGFISNASDAINKVSGTSGIGISGDVSINDVNDTTQAFISDGVTVNVGDDLTVQAINEAPLMLAISGALAFETSKQSSGVVLAGSFTLNDLDRDVRAYTDNATITANNVDVLATNRDFFLSITAGAAGTKRGAAAVAGSVNLNLIDTNLVSALGDNAKLTARGNVSVEARDTLPIVSVAGAISAGAGAGIGASVDVSLINRNVSAFIGKNAIVTLAGNLDVQALTQEEIVSVAASLVPYARQLGVVGQATSQNLNTNVSAYIATGAIVSANQNILVEAQDITNIGDRNRLSDTIPPNVTIVASGATFTTSGSGFGASLANLNLNRNINSYIADGATVDAYAIGNNPILTGDYETGRTFNPRGDANLGIPAAVDEVNNTIDLGAGHGLVTGDAVVYDTGGGGDIGGLEDRKIYYVLVDTANSNKVRLVKSRADALAGRNIIDLSIVPGRLVGFERGTIGITHRLDRVSKRVDVDGLVVKANVVDTINLASATAAVSLAVGSTGVGSISIQTNNTNVSAYIGDGATNVAGGAKINQGNRLAAETDQSVTVTSNYDASILGVAGGISGAAAGQAAIGASIDTQVLTANVSAYIGDFAVVRAADDVTVKANTKQTIQSFAVTAAVSLNIVGSGVQGSVSVIVLNNTTQAFIANDAQVTAGQDIIVAADDSLFLRVVDAGIAGGGNAGVSGSVGVVTENNNIIAYIGDRATVTAQGNVSVAANNNEKIEMGVGSGGFSLGAGLGASIAVLVRSDNVIAYIGESAKVTAKGLGNSFIAPAGYDGAIQSMRGLSITATSNEDILVVAVAGGGALTTGIAGSVPVVILSDSTNAAIRNGAQINANNSDADARQSINVLAVDTTKVIGGSGSLGVGGLTGVGAGLEQRTITKNTEAYIGAAQVNAKGDIQVRALSREDLLAVAAAGGLGGSTGLAGAVGVQILTIKTRAFGGGSGGYACRRYFGSPE